MPSNLVDITPVELCVATKKPTLVAARPTINVREALRMMAENNFVSLPIYSHNSDDIVTIINIVDILNYIIKEAISDDKMPSEIHSEKAHNLDKPIESVMTLDSDQESYRIFKADANDTMKATLKAFSKRIHRTLVIDYNNKIPPFILTQSDVIKYVQAHLECLPTIDFKSSLQSLGLINKERKIIIGHDNETALNVYRRLAENKLLGIAIVNSKKELVGNLSASDLRGLSYESIDSLVLPVLEFLAKLGNPKLLDPITATPECSLEMVLKLLTDNRIHRVWITDDKRNVKDVITLTDLISFFLQH
ncbi:CBS-domain-containing protein [Gigaspora margarita]|uniref:CBS-domain-containing protein n=1 Tax=Gigaspora margarita TaxID=4874 RepID=A0A8H3XH44_GIGMA|nr:CBS-domain-containing protein [Gigaspora margarita]